MSDSWIDKQGDVPTTPAPRLGGERGGEASVCWACGELVQHSIGHKCEAFDD